MVLISFVLLALPANGTTNAPATGRDDALSLADVRTQASKDRGFLAVISLFGVPITAFPARESLHKFCVHSLID